MGADLATPVPGPAPDLVPDMAKDKPDSLRRVSQKEVEALE